MHIDILLLCNYDAYAMNMLIELIIPFAITLLFIELYYLPVILCVTIVIKQHKFGVVNIITINSIKISTMR